MLTSIQKMIFIPALTMGVGFLFSISGGQAVQSEKEYPEHLVGSFTGGFGEETCHSCHFDYELNRQEGSLSVDGILNEIEEGRTYEFGITIEREDMEKAGFQLSARFSDGSQAGIFQLGENDRVMFTKQVPDSLQYLQHSEQGTSPIKDGENSWKVVWKAPDSIPDAIHFHIAANAANGDQSEFGDWIYQRSYKVVGRK